MTLQLVSRIRRAGRVGLDLEVERWCSSIALRLFGEHGSLALGRLTIVEEIGRGAGGTVYAAHDPRLDRRVAVKVLADHAPHPSHALQREARALAKLAHPNVVHVYDVGEHEGLVYIVMELVDGGTLADRIRELEPRDRVLRMFIQAGRGLAAAHTAGLVHGDFKPANVLVGTDGRVRVSDFGLARLAQVQPQGPQGSAQGTPAYMAPEHILAGRNDARSDQFAFCVSLWEALEGARPFRGADQAELADRLRECRLPRRPDGVPRWLYRVIARGLSKDPADRYDSMEDLVGALAPRRRRVRRAIALACVGAVVSVGTIGAAQPSSVSTDECDALAADAELRWTERQRPLLADALAAGDTELSQTVAGRVLPAMDEHVQRWIAATRETCAHAEPQLVLQRRLCLEWEAQDFGALVEVLSDPELGALEHAISGVERLHDPRQCLETTIDRTALRPAVAADRSETVLALERRIARARALSQTGQPRLAITEGREALSAAQRLGRTQLRTRALLVLGTAQAELIGTPAGKQAPTTLLAALMAAEASGLVEVRALSMVELASAHARLGELESAEHYVIAALPVVSGRFDGAEHAGRLWSSMAVVSEARGQLDVARTNYERAIGVLEDAGVRDGLALERALTGLGELLFISGLYDDARAHYVQALDMAKTRYGPHHPRVAGNLANVAEVDLLAGDLDSALEGFAAAEAIRVDVYGEKSVWVAHTRAHLADVHLRRRDTSAALKLYRDALETAQELTPAGREPMSYVEFDMGLDVLEPWARNGLALAHLARGEFAKAEHQARQALAAPLHPRYRHPDLRARRDVLAFVLLAQGRAQEAARHLAGARQAVERAFAPTHRYRGWMPYARGLVALELGDRPRAISELQAALKIFAADAGASPDLLDRVRTALAVGTGRAPRTDVRALILRAEP